MSGLSSLSPIDPKGDLPDPLHHLSRSAAVALGVPLSQPKTSSELEAAIVSEEFDLGVVVAYGRILKPEVLAATRNGYLNVHFSLLPRWRGAAPVARAIMAGDQMTGVTIIRLDEGLDTGPVLTAQAVDIGAQETAGALTTRLADLGASLISSALPAYLSTALTPLPQSDEGATYADKVTKSDRPLDTDATVVEAVNQVRGLAPVPGATTQHRWRAVQDPGGASQCRQARIRHLDHGRGGSRGRVWRWWPRTYLGPATGEDPPVGSRLAQGCTTEPRICQLSHRLRA